MRTTLLTTATALLSLSYQALAQDAAAPTATPTDDGSGLVPPSGLALPSSANVNAIVSYLIPTLTSTSLSPSQSAAILSEAAAYVQSYTSATPLQAVTSGIAVAGLLAETRPNESQIAEIRTLLEAAPSALVNDPGAFVGSVDTLLSPFPFLATRVSSYEQGFQGGLATVVAQELSVEPPAPTAFGGGGEDGGSSSSGSSEEGAAAAAAGARPAVVAAAVGAIVGVLAFLV